MYSVFKLFSTIKCFVFSNSNNKLKLMDENQFEFAVKGLF